MPYNVNDKELVAVLRLPPPKRYQYFVKRVVDPEIAWSLGRIGGWAPLGDAEDHEVMPVWPHKRFAAACASGSWSDNEPRSISLPEWIKAWPPGIAQDDRRIAMFPTPDGKGPIVMAQRLKADLEEELRNYE